MHAHIGILIAICIIAGSSPCAAVQVDQQNIGICELCEEKLTRYQKELNLQQRENDLQNKEINALKSELDAVKRLTLGTEKPSSGVSYVRWGRNTCQESVSIVYKGDCNS